MMIAVRVVPLPVDWLASLPSGERARIVFTYTRSDLWPATRETDGIRRSIASWVAAVWLKARSNYFG